MLMICYLGEPIRMYTGEVFRKVFFPGKLLDVTQL